MLIFLGLGYAPALLGCRVDPAGTGAVRIGSVRADLDIAGQGDAEGRSLRRTHAAAPGSTRCFISHARTSSMWYLVTRSEN